MTKTEQFEFLQQLGFDVPRNESVPIGDIPKYFEIAKESRESLDYDIDGLVLSVEDLDQLKALGFMGVCPRGQVALKFPAQGSIVTIKDIEWSAEGGQHIVPVAIFDPVLIVGAEIRRASLKSIEWMLENQCGIGSVVEIVRSGDIIPKVESIVSNLEHRIEPPTVCPICGAPVIRDGAHLACENDLCWGKEANRMYKFLHALKVKGLGVTILLDYAKLGVTLLDFFQRDEFKAVEEKIQVNPKISKVIWGKIKKSLLEYQNT